MEELSYEEQLLGFIVGEVQADLRRHPRQLCTVVQHGPHSDPNRFAITWCGEVLSTPVASWLAIIQPARVEYYIRELVEEILKLADQQALEAISMGGTEE